MSPVGVVARFTPAKDHQLPITAGLLHPWTREIDNEAASISSSGESVALSTETATLKTIESVDGYETLVEYGVGGVDVEFSSTRATASG